MSIKVLVVDDSSFFRRRVSDILNQDSDLEVIDTAVNGKDAIEKAKLLKPDVITMDVEMPVMDGITSVKGIMKVQPTPILMFSSLTHEGAQSTLDALDAGAVDFLPKKFEDIARDKKDAIVMLQTRVKAIAKRPGRASPFSGTPAPSTSSPKPLSRSRPSSLSSSSSSASSLSSLRSSSVGSTSSSALKRTEPESKAATAPPPLVTRKGGSNGDYKLLAIGCSTGGPVALQTILTQFPASYPYPIIIIQHMPAAFTAAFAARLNTLCNITIKEAENGDTLKPGVAYLAPGGKQLVLEGNNSPRIKIIEDDSPRITYKPSVDISFGSAAKIYRNKVLAVVLTGMGADGKEGARLLKQSGSKILAQDEASCVVYGMPQAVTAAGLTSGSYPLNDMANQILKETGYG
ncbi:protein-glutamate methylesterase/protein-glutamine glutaminase [Flocculibacter collagenilyticus]|uniref:protein-glutamate methylesterase/protein-glutamine glutaminase n=1 Tax=Flocculibacter collagenilyticus TaxID=2744479 RepID=UPI0018F2FBFD|nr:chemotaxis response regulator protein-glutamate methylesterase [Flocculibacter collagenilyticus]